MNETELVDQLEGFYYREQSLPGVTLRSLLTRIRPDCCFDDCHRNVCLTCYDQLQTPFCEHYSKSPPRVRYIQDHIISFEENCRWVQERTDPPELKQDAWLDSILEFNKVVQDSLKRDDGRPSMRVILLDNPDGADVTPPNRGRAMRDRIKDMCPGSHIKIEYQQIKDPSSQTSEVGRLADAIESLLMDGHVAVICVCFTALSRDTEQYAIGQLSTVLKRAWNQDIPVFFPEQVFSKELSDLDSDQTWDSNSTVSKGFWISPPSPLLADAKKQDGSKFSFPQYSLSDGTVWHGASIACASATGLAISLLFCATLEEFSVWRTRDQQGKPKRFRRVAWLKTVFEKMTEAEHVQEKDFEFVDVRRHLRIGADDAVETSTDPTFHNRVLTQILQGLNW